MQIDEKRLARQNKGVDIFFDNNGQGICDYTMGFGKTYFTQLVINRFEKIEKRTYLITVPGSELELQWTKTLKESFPKHLIERITIKTAAALLIEDINYEVAVQIVDEIHEFSTEERLKLINNTRIKRKHFLGLTGTSDDKNFWKIKKLHKVIDTISIEEAKEEGWIADFIEYNLGLSLTPAEKEAYDSYTNTISKHMPKFENDLGHAQKVISGGKDKHGKYYAGASWAYSLAVKKGWKKDLDLAHEANKITDNLWNPNLFIGYARSLINAIRNRRNLLNNALAKYNMTVELVNKFNNVKTIIFSESTDFADKIGVVLNNNNHPTVIYHSNLKTIAKPGKTGKLIKFGKTRLKKEALDNIKLGKARVLSTAKSLDRGLDIKDLRFSITASGSQNPTQYKQRNGRSTRKEEDSIFSDMPVLLVNLYIIDTQDELWLKNRQAKSSNNPIVVNTIDDISYHPPANAEFTINDI